MSASSRYAGMSKAELKRAVYEEFWCANKSVNNAMQAMGAEITFPDKRSGIGSLHYDLRSGNFEIKLKT